MCGRFTYYYTWSQLHRLLNIHAWPAEELKPSYNACPTQFTPVVRHDTLGPRVSLLRWGLVPSWAKDEAIGSRLINARSEEAAKKPAFQAALKSRRCIVPVSGFYEWEAIEGQRHKQPWYFYPDEGGVLPLAGLWERWGDGDALIETFTVLTGPPNSAVAPMHDRTPVIVPLAMMDEWLDPASPRAAELIGTIAQQPEPRLHAHRVSAAVNAPRHNHSGLIRHVEAPPRQTLW